MVVKVDFYQIVLRFPRLFPDPVVFENQQQLVIRYLTANSVSAERARLIFQVTDEIVGIDDRGNPSTTSGTAKYQFEGHTILAEYMTDANVRIEYTDFGTGLSREDHLHLWDKGKIGGLRFELREFKHEHRTLNIPEAVELYTILKKQASPTTLSAIELDSVSDNLFKVTLDYLTAVMRTAAESDGLELEIYAARNLRASEKAALEKRLARLSNKSTVFVILSRPSAGRVHTLIP